MEVPLLELKSIKKKFGNHTVLKNVNCEIGENELFGLLGRSGAGKSTIINILLGLLKEDGGQIFYRGKPIKKERSVLRKKIGFARQENSFYPKLTVLENMQYYGRMFRIPRKVLEPRISHLLGLMRISFAKNTPAGSLSGGMKRRLDLAISLLHDPEILILDEPTTGIDVVLQHEIWELINKIHKDGKTIIVSSHMLHQLQKHCTNYGLLYKGEFYNKHHLTEYSNKYHIRDLEELFLKAFYMPEH